MIYGWTLDNRFDRLLKPPMMPRNVIACRVRNTNQSQADKFFGSISKSHTSRVDAESLRVPTHLSKMTSTPDEGDVSQENTAIGISFGNSFSSIAYTTSVSHPRFTDRLKICTDTDR